MIGRVGLTGVEMGWDEMGVSAGGGCRMYYGVLRVRG